MGASKSPPIFGANQMFALYLIKIPHILMNPFPFLTQKHFLLGITLPHN